MSVTQQHDGRPSVGSRRRPRQQAPRPRTVRFDLTEAEFNQAVMKLNATGQRPDELIPVAQACLRRVERLDAAAEQLRKTVR